ncbi:MAG: Gfo/Idh/MocA family oxidoreductase [Planctomycetaceae bacterium]|nr:Gfo/Idh/MocA family oxidoreductase [Planctomycetaceae bacterium]
MKPTQHSTTRREFLRNTGRIAAASALAGATAPWVHAAEQNTIQVALVGCGGRGSGAALNALSVKNGPVRLVAMADVFPARLDGDYTWLMKSAVAKQIDVPKDRRFIGFDAYQKAMDCLNPGDVVILATPPAFRWPHFDYAIKKGLHVFMEKPTTVDGPSTRKMLALAEESVRKNLKVGVGLMQRHCPERIELHDRIRSGQAGEILTMRAYRMHGPAGSFSSGPKPKDASELMYQIQRFHSFLWASGGCFSDFYVHSIDECCWMKDAWPTQAMALGGRHYRGDSVDQNFDNYSVEYTFADGTKFYFYGRTMPRCYEEFASYAHGTKGLAVVSGWNAPGGQCRIYDGQKFDKSKLAWRSRGPKSDPYQLEWDDLIDAIRQDKPYNEAKRGAEASLVTSMGRMAAHTGQVIDYDAILNLEHEFAPDVDKLTMESPSPLLAGADGRYPVPQPGITTQREY